MWHNSLRDPLSKPGSISAATRQLQLPSKLVTEMMNSDSDDSNRDQEQNQSDDEQLFGKAYTNVYLKENQNQSNIYNNVKQNIVVEKQETRSYRQLSTAPPPLVLANQDKKPIAYRNEKQKQNTPSHINHNKDRNLRQTKEKNVSQIKYSCFKVDGNKLIQSRAQFGQYNSLNLDDASLIPDGNQLLMAEIDKFKEERKQNCRKINELQNQNRNLKKQIVLVQEQSLTKDNFYNSLEQKLIQKNKEIESLINKISSLQTQISQLNEQKESSSKVQPIHRQFNSKKRQGELSKYLSNMMDKSSNKSGNFEGGQKISRLNQQNPKRELKNTGFQPSSQAIESERIYKQVTQYLMKKIHQFKDKLLGNRMSMAVQEIIEQFMTEIVNINPIAVSRAISTAKSRATCTPNRSKFRNAVEQESKISSTLIMSVIMPKQSLTHQSLRSNVTPIKKLQDRQKSTQLLNLEKSLHKLRQMQKSYAPVAHDTNKDNGNLQNNNSYIGASYESLDRSLIGLDRSNRSKSRRKKIFQ